MTRSPNGHVTAVVLSAIEKRYAPTKCYVFILNVTWSTGQQERIYRTYSDFYEFHMQLLDLFPGESGQNKDKKMIIPHLPGRKIFQRSEIHSVACQRQTHLSEYCKDLLTLPPYISQSHVVVEFFTYKDSDKQPTPTTPEKSGVLQAILPFLQKKVHDITGMKKSSSFTAGMSEEEVYISGPITFPEFIVIADYKASEKKDVSLKKGQEISVVEKHDNGWWFVQFGDTQGWAPASYLEPSTSADKEQDDPTALIQSEQFEATCAFSRNLKDEVSFSQGSIVNVLHKMMDGWWVIAYCGEVGYAPATYLRPHSGVTKTSQEFTDARQPTQRRCTIKNKHTNMKEKTVDDLDIYKSNYQKQNLLTLNNIGDNGPHIYVNDCVVTETDDSDERFYENESVINYLAAQKTQASINLQTTPVVVQPSTSPKPTQKKQGPKSGLKEALLAKFRSKESLNPSPPKASTSTSGPESYPKSPSSPFLIYSRKTNWETTQDDMEDDEEEDDYTDINEAEMNHFYEPAVPYLAPGGIDNLGMDDSESEDYDDVADELYVNMNRNANLNVIPPPPQASKSPKLTRVQQANNSALKVTKPPNRPPVELQLKPQPTDEISKVKVKPTLGRKPKPIPVPRHGIAARVALFENC